MKPKPTVLIADDHLLVATGVANSLEHWYHVTGVVTSLEALADTLRSAAPNVVLLDLTFGKHSAMSVLGKLSDAHPETRFVIVTMHEEPVFAEAALAAGAWGFVVKQSAPTELRIAIEEVLAGRRYVTPLIQARGVRADGILPATEGVDLTDLERRIVELLRVGYSQRRIGEEIGKNAKAVEYQVGKLRRRIGVSHTSQLIRWAERVFADEERRQQDPRSPA